MFNSYYSLSFNPFDKQQVRESDAFISKDFTEMRSRLDYLKGPIRKMDGSNKEKAWRPLE